MLPVVCVEAVCMDSGTKKPRNPNLGAVEMRKVGA
jgi:hypothetical protein